MAQPPSSQDPAVLGHVTPRLLPMVCAFRSPAAGVNRAPAFSSYPRSESLQPRAGRTPYGEGFVVVGSGGLKGSETRNVVAIAVPPSPAEFRLTTRYFRRAPRVPLVASGPLALPLRSPLKRTIVIAVTEGASRGGAAFPAQLPTAMSPVRNATRGGVVWRVMARRMATRDRNQETLPQHARCRKPLLRNPSTRGDKGPSNPNVAPARNHH